jgi:hypothetical protein
VGVLLGHSDLSDKEKNAKSVPAAGPLLRGIRSREGSAKCGGESICELN